MPYSLIPHKKTRAIHAVHSVFGTLLLRSFPSTNHLTLHYNSTTPTYISNHHSFPSLHHSNITVNIPEHTWQRFRAFLLASIIHLQHLQLLLPSQIQDIFKLLSTHPDTCRHLIHYTVHDNLHDQWHVFRLFLLDALLHFKHLNFILTSQYKHIISNFSNFHDSCRLFIPLHIPNTPSFANETFIHNTLLLSFKQHLFLPQTPHLFVMDINSHSDL